VNERRERIIAGAVSLVVALGVLVFLLMPRISAVGKRTDDLAAAQQEQQTLENSLTALKSDKAEDKKAQKTLARLETKIPPTADVPSLVRLLQNAADSAAVDFFSVSPGTPTVASTGISVISTQITVSGGFFSVEEFLFKMETLPRAVRVTQISVGPGGEDQTKLQLTMNAEVYTTDANAGPGSSPGHTEGGAVPGAPTPVPSGTPAPVPSTTITGG